MIDDGDWATRVPWAEFPIGLRDQGFQFVYVRLGAGKGGDFKCDDLCQLTVK